MQKGTAHQIGFGLEHATKLHLKIVGLDFTNHVDLCGRGDIIGNHRDVITNCKTQIVQEIVVLLLVSDLVSNGGEGLSRGCYHNLRLGDDNRVANHLNYSR